MLRGKTEFYSMPIYLCVCNDNRQCGFFKIYCTVSAVFRHEHGCRNQCSAVILCRQHSTSSPVNTTFTSSAQETTVFCQSLGETVIQSIFEGNVCVPLVSMATFLPCLCNKSINDSVICRLGSPPVRITQSTAYVATFSAICSSVISTKSR